MLLGLFLACWLVALLHLVGLLSLAGTLDLGLYPFYGIAAALGWVSGNLYVHGRRALPARARRLLLVVYFLAPPGLLYLLRAMAPAALQAAAPFVALYACAVFAVFFLVPVTLTGTAPTRRR